MSKLFLIRSSCGIACDTYYEEKTDVWFLGDVSGYKIFVNRLRSAVAGKRNHHLWSLARHECNMLLSIVPPISGKGKRPQMRFWERLVFYQSKPWMELVISGNLSGYKLFISQLEFFLKDLTDDFSSHAHFDDQNNDQNWIRTRSVSLNFRGPVKQWTPEKVWESGYGSFLKRKLPETIPADMHYYFRRKKQPGQTALPKYHEISQAQANDVWKCF